MPTKVLGPGGRLCWAELEGTAAPRVEVEGCDRVGADDVGWAFHDGKIFFILIPLCRPDRVLVGVSDDVGVSRLWL